ncbi:cellulose binding domain-containing protein [Rugosimonospora acidiphila]|uniref:Cellulose binding domain-containing protein n=1 Tax=Rugosimonospora acidiphila TaxID=556531 RepID=A0ABP9S1R7_9ACTN
MKRRRIGSRVPIRLLTLSALAVTLGAPAFGGPGAANAAAPSAVTFTGPTAGSAAAPHDLGTSGWKVLTSATATQTGDQISTPGFSTAHWLSVRPDDGDAPGTEIEALLQNGACPNPYYSDNIRTCFGFTDDAGPVSVPQFAVPWWYRTDFSADLRPGQTASLIVNGVVGAADVWVNGSEVATKATVTGDYTKFTFDVSTLLHRGKNSLALEVYPNDPSTMLTLDDVDWNQVPPDNNTGIQFPIQLKVSDALSESNAHVLQANAADLSSSALTVKTDVTNNTAAPQTGTVRATVTPPGHGGKAITVTQSVTVPAHTTQTVSFTPDAYRALTIRHPQIWWPYQMGASPLYTLRTSVSQRGAVTDSASATFGIRTVTTSLVGASPIAPDGVRSYAINGRSIVVRGGGFAEDLFLHYDATDIARQFAILKNLGINTLRLEGHFMPENFYEQADAAGMLIDSGFQCCDAWQPGKTISQATLDTMALSALTIGQNERNHPSVFTFSWSDNAPRPQQEAVSLPAFQQADFDVPIVASAEYKSTPTLGQAGEKEGPYDYVPPSYWYDTSNYDPGDSSRTNAGGSWGLDSEQSAGDTVPTMDSLNRFLSPADQAALWQQPDANQYHANYETGHGGYRFGTLFEFDQAMTNRYGSWSSLDQYVEEAQVQNYENTRAQFEAFVDHSTNQPTPATGTIYWQVNKGWPTLLWDLYNQDGDQPGSFFGAKKANEGLHVLYGYDDGTVAVDNLTGKAAKGLSVQAKVYDLAGNVLDDQRVGGLSLTSQQVTNKVLTPKVPAATVAPTPAKTSFVELQLSQNGKVVDRNVYWVSSQADQVDWDATLGNPQATMSQYADLTALHSLPTNNKIAAKVSTHAQAGPDGADRVATVTITNTSKTRTVGFFLRADLRRGTRSGKELPGDNEVGSALWSDNDITLWPGESQTLTVSYRASDLKGATPVVSVSGWNSPRIDVAG